MFLDLVKAQAVDPNITQENIDALEQTVRGITNNHFHVQTTARHFVGKQTLGFSGDLITLPNLNGVPLQGAKDLLQYLRKGDTLEIYGTGLNDGVYEIVTVDSTATTLQVRVPDHQGGEFVPGNFPGSLVKIHYPADIATGVLRLIGYDVTMSEKLGIKSETVSRLSVTYFDTIGSDTSEGYPLAYMNFLIKYRHMNWG